MLRRATYWQTRRTAALRRWSWRGFSSAADSSQHVAVLRRPDDATATLMLQSPPINALSLPLVTQLTAAVRELEADDSIRGFVLASSSSRVFSGGIHLPELLLGDNGSTDGIATFWSAFQQLALVLHGTPLASVAAVSGACPAGGCLLALCCDERLMAHDVKGTTIGLNEAAFGLVPPYWLCDLLVGAVGSRRAESMITRGTLLGPGAALDAGLIDELVEGDAIADAAHARLLELLLVPDASRAGAKTQMRAAWAEELRRRRGEDLAHVLEFVRSSEVQGAVQSYLKALRGGAGRSQSVEQ